MSREHVLTYNPVGHLAGDHRWIVKLGRVGWFAKGVVYLVAGVLALLIAANASAWSSAVTTSNQEASPTGALKTIAQMTGGSLLMWALAAGMLLYVTWRVGSALLPGASDIMGWLMRIGYVISAVIYITFAATAISLALSAEANPDGNTEVSSISQGFMAHTGGGLVIGVVGAITIAVGLYRLSKGIRGDVTDELNLSSLSQQRRRWTKRLGEIGEIGRGIGIGLIGFFLLRAAVTYDPAEATGLDGALRRLATEDWGLVVVAVVGVGFAAYGLFCLATFTHRELEGP